MSTRLPASFFRQPAPEVARGLLGARLACEEASGIIVETEAYLGPEDLASHARFISSKRNRVMYERGGTAYVYLCYGIHQMFNVVAGKNGDPCAVLIRALADPDDNRSRAYSGPGKLTSALGISSAHNGLAINAPQCPLQILSGDTLDPGAIAVTPRIGVGYAGRWASEPLRFCLAAHPAVSG